VGFDISSNPEIIEENMNGFLIPPFDIDKLSERVGELIDNREKRERMGEYAKRSVYSRFDYANSLRNVEEYIYNNQ